MCFKTEIHLSRTEIENRFGRTFKKGEEFEPRYYFSAFDFPKMPVICQQESSVIQMMHWGLIPEWISNKDEAFDFRKNTLNAKFETLDEKKSFQQSVDSQRCLLINHGFFEYRHENSKKIPYYIRRKDNEAFAIACIFSNWQKEEMCYAGFSLITCEANSLLSSIHNSQKRMPLMLEPELGNIWLDEKWRFRQLKNEMKAIESDKLEAWPINEIPLRNINYLNSPQLLEPRKVKNIPQQLNLFDTI